MKSKITAARIASESGVPVVICNGTSAGTLAAAVAGERVGTRLGATHGGQTPPYKLWLKYAKQTSGVLTVDRGAARVLRESGSSLLAVGIVESSGAFDAGDAVLVVDGAGAATIGKGISEFGSHDMARIMGQRSDYLREHFPDSPDEVIHRDRFVLL